MNAQPAPTPIAAETATAAPPAAEPGADGDAARYAAFESPRTFLGPEAGYYDESWRWMDWTGRRWSWNPAAALGFAGWLAYRRMYGLTVPAVLWLVLAATLVARGGPIVLIAALHVGFALLLGLYGNTLYLNHFRRLARTVREDDHDKCLAALARLGGTSRRAVVVVAAVTVALIAAAVHAVGGEGVTLRWR